MTEATANHGALALCRGCPVRQACAGYAVALTDVGVHLVGTWGGVFVPLTTGRRQAMARLRALAGEALTP